MSLGVSGLGFAIIWLYLLFKKDVPVWLSPKAHYVIQTFMVVNIVIGLYIASSLVGLRVPGAEFLDAYVVLVPCIAILAIYVWSYYAHRSAHKHKPLTKVQKDTVISILTGIVIVVAVPNVIFMSMLVFGGMFGFDSMLPNIILCGYPALIILLAVQGSKLKSIPLAASAAIIAAFPLTVLTFGLLFYSVTQ